MSTYSEWRMEARAKNKKTYKVIKVGNVYEVKNGNKHIDVFPTKEEANNVAMFLNGGFIKNDVSKMLVIQFIEDLKRVDKEDAANIQAIMEMNTPSGIYSEET